MRPERFARGAEQSRHARRRARQDSHKPGAAGTPDRSRPRQARRAFLLGPLFRSVAGAVSRGAGCMTMRIAYVCADPGVPVFGRKGCSVHVQEMLRALQGHAAGADRVAARAFRAASVLLAVSAEVAAWLERRGVARGRVHVIPNGVDAERFRPDVRPAAPGPPGSFTVGFVGSMKPWHGLDVLVEAFARLHERAPDARLLLVGDGPARAAVCADLSAPGLNGVGHWTEAVAPREVPGLLTSVDVAVAPYPQATGFYFSPLKVYEYLAAGRAVVASRVGQLETVIRHDVNGLLCPPGDAAALAAALERLRCEPALRARLGRAARATVVRKPTWDAVAARVLELAAAAVEA